MVTRLKLKEINGRAPGKYQLFDDLCTLDIYTIPKTKALMKAQEMAIEMVLDLVQVRVQEMAQDLCLWKELMMVQKMVQVKDLKMTLW